jgi:DNA invertase Pin-like site-specific DNA recombinase
MTNTLNIEQLFFIVLFLITCPILYYIGLKIGEKKYTKKQNSESIDINKNSENNYVKEVDRYLDGLTIKLPDNYEDIIAKWCNGEFTANETAKKLGVSRTTLYNRFGHMRNIKN